MARNSGKTGWSEGMRHLTSSQGSTPFRCPDFVISDVLIYRGKHSGKARLNEKC